MDNKRGEKIRSARIKKGITQQQLGKKINRARNTVACYETGTRQPSFHVAKKICKVLGLDLTKF